MPIPLGIKAFRFRSGTVCPTRFKFRNKFGYGKDVIELPCILFQKEKNP